MRIPLFLVLVTTVFQPVLAQVSFENGHSLIHDREIRSTLSMGVADMNGDYKDDLVFLDQGTDLIIGYQTQAGYPFKLVENGPILDNVAWALSLGDLDNDGISEIFTCGINTFGNVFKRDVNNQYVFTQLLYGLTFPQNSNMVDINNDGWLDVFACDERAYNDLYLNDQTGTLKYNDFINMHTVPPSNDSGNYGSEWVDFDDDQDIDLFITKCKPAITEPDDPLRLNVLFVNDGEEQYEEKSADFGLKNGSQSWTGSFGDLDNDGDLDCFVSNHDTTHVIYENINNDTFIDVTSDWMIPLHSSSIQAAIRDFDNNGFMDIYVSGDRDYMIWNQGNRQMVVQDDPLGLLNVFSFATGDLNDDGFLDILASHGLLNMPGDYDDIIWLNKGNEYHYLKMSFLGESSNRKGVGSKVKLYSSLGIMTRDVKIGESYGTTNSGNVHFGLGNETHIDSLIVYWPSGQIDRYYDVLPDQHVLVHEGTCLSPFIDIQHAGDNVLCQGESMQLALPLELENITWSTGDNTPEITVDAKRDVWVKGYNATSCAVYSNVKTILYEPDQTPEIILAEGALNNCLGDTVTLMTAEATAYEWSTGAITPSIEVTKAGAYSVSISGKCAEFGSAPLQIDFFDVAEPVLTDDTIYLKEAGTVMLQASGSNIHWYAGPEDLIPLGTGIIETDVINSDTVFYAADFDEQSAEVQSVGMKEHMGTPLGGSSLNSGLMFNCFKKLRLEEVKVITDIPGFRTLELKQLDPLTGEEQLLDTKRIWIASGTQVLTPGFEINPGLHYILTTNADSNLVNIGTKSPALYRANQGVHFPYELEDMLEITTSLHGLSYYYYFFNWKVRSEGIACFSERVPQYVVMDTLTGLMPDPFEKEKLFIYPNPGRDKVVFEWSQQNPIEWYHVKLVSADGRVMTSIKLKDRITLDTVDFPPGVYFAMLYSTDGKLIDQRRVVILP